MYVYMRCSWSTATGTGQLLVASYKAGAYGVAIDSTNKPWGRSYGRYLAKT